MLDFNAPFDHECGLILYWYVRLSSHVHTVRTALGPPVAYLCVRLSALSRYTYVQLFFARLLPNSRTEFCDTVVTANVQERTVGYCVYCTGLCCNNVLYNT